MALFFNFMRDTYTIADELVNVAHVAMYTMLSHSHKDDLGDLIQKREQIPNLSMSWVQKSACTH